MPEKLFIMTVGHGGWELDNILKAIKTQLG